ncbi:MAG: glutamate racemase [Candidatus Omnitrophica bacterium]|nr:glutamate racemase [Candidatus Omnitrophota bacterium]MDD5429946.1 glutamate racemase [Candidatus Omnitrophota bacterium]
MNKKPIGIFDSGVGGLTVLREVRKALPKEDVVYFGDTARVPYGNKSQSTIIAFSRQNALFLLRKKVKMIIVACNTSSALALSDLKKNMNIPVVGVIDSGVIKALKNPDNKKIAIIGTRSTIKSKSYEKAIKKINPDIKVYSKSCPLFVPLVEEGVLNGRISDEVIKMYLEDIKRKGIDALILGCTHYPLLKKSIRSYLKDVNVIDSAKEVALYVSGLLTRKNLLNTGGGKRIDFYVSDEPAGFGKLAKLFLKKNILKPRVVNV